MFNSPVLVLNQSYEPLNVCRVRRAIVLIYQEKAEMLENGAGFIHTVNRDFPIPSVIRLATMARRPYRADRRMTRLEIFRRDKFTCQYCGREFRQLTLDHVIPRSRGGQHTWENVVSACASCNRKKAGRTPNESRHEAHQRAGQTAFQRIVFYPGSSDRDTKRVEEIPSPVAHATCCPKGSSRAAPSASRPARYIFPRSMSTVLLESRR